MHECSRANPPQPMEFLANHFLIAMPGMEDPNFGDTVTLICEHSAAGALGLIVNRPMQLQLEDVFAQLGFDATASPLGTEPVYKGGPVQPDRGFVLHPRGGEWDSTLIVSDTLQLTTSRDVLAAMATGEGPSRALFALGYAGWDAGQLESELAANAWLSVAAEDGIIFDVPHAERWHHAARLLGVDPAQLSSYAGNA